MYGLLTFGLVSGAHGQITPCYDCENDVVIGGYDVVEPFKSGEGFVSGVKGSRSHSTTHFGYTFWFSSADNLETFQQNPSKYLPAYGGF